MKLGELNFLEYIGKEEQNLLTSIVNFKSEFDLFYQVDKIYQYSGPQNLDSVISYTWDIKRGGPSGTNAQEVSAFI